MINRLLTVVALTISVAMVLWVLNDKEDLDLLSLEHQGKLEAMVRGHNHDYIRVHGKWYKSTTDNYDYMLPPEYLKTIIPFWGDR